ncbi:MAG: DUF4193 domain-containing protein [Candidatus Ancillula trichonymphae]|jgi:hypothetical protein|nr:DUF4193 domain-containing protein [Candidatus Ancillula trichonymphae]
MVDDSIIEDGIDGTETEVIGTIDELKLKAASYKRVNMLDEEDIDNASWYELPGIVNISDDGSVNVAPKKFDEFTCYKCFLIKHYGVLSASSSKDAPICKDCE